MSQAVFGAARTQVRRRRISLKESGYPENWWVYGFDETLILTADTARAGIPRSLSCPESSTRASVDAMLESRGPSRDCVSVPVLIRGPCSCSKAPLFLNGRSHTVRMRSLIRPTSRTATQVRNPWLSDSSLEAWAPGTIMNAIPIRATVSSGLIYSLATPW